MPALTRRWFAIAVGLMVLGLWARLHGHLGDELWWDEVLTRTRYATGDPLAAFGDYAHPNNHILFSVWLSCWVRISTWLPFELPLRGVMLVQCLLTLPLLVATASRLGGRRAGVAAGLLFLCSSITPTFALQLRGYGLSWIPLLLALYALLRRGDGGRWPWLLLYAASVTVAIGIVPTNALACAILLVWYPLRRKPLAEQIAVACAPALGLLVYVPVWADLLGHVRGFDAHQTSLGFALAWLRGLGGDFWPLLGAFAGGLWLLARRTRRPVGPARIVARARLGFVGAALVAPAIALTLLRNVPFPRTLVPALPLFCIALAIPLGAVLAEAARRGPTVGRAAGILVCLCALRAIHRPVVPSEDPRPQTLTEAYYQREFHPSRVARAQIELEASGRPPLLFEARADPMAIQWAQMMLARERGRPPRVSPPLFPIPGSAVNMLRLPDDLRGQRLVVVAHDALSALEASRALKLNLTVAPQLLMDTGFFKLYELHASF